MLPSKQCLILFSLALNKSSSFCRVIAFISPRFSASIYSCMIVFSNTSTSETRTYQSESFAVVSSLHARLVLGLRRIDWEENSRCVYWSLVDWNDSQSLFTPVSSIHISGVRTRAPKFLQDFCDCWPRRGVGAFNSRHLWLHFSKG